jgi:hypothetical protein
MISLFVKNIHPFMSGIRKSKIKIYSGTLFILEDERGFILAQVPDRAFA